MFDYGSIFAIPPTRSIWEWAEDNIVLGARQPTRYKGKYRASLTPYVRGIFDAIHEPLVHTVTIMKAAQSGLTLVSHCTLCYWITEDPDPVLLVMPTQDLGQSVSETRIQPLIEDSPLVAKEKQDAADSFKKTVYVLRRATVNIVGANSPANLASRPIRYLILDEVDKFPEQTQKEARAVNLAIERTKTYEDFRKILEISTPTNKRGYIYESAMDADMRKYFVPCPACGEMQVMEWANIKFDSEKPIQEAAGGAYYECSKCKAHWSDKDKNNAVQKGEWRATQTSKDIGHVSFHLPAWYAPWVTWSACVTEFLSTKNTPSEFQNFVNSWMAEVWTDPPKKNIAVASILKARDKQLYDRGHVPTSEPALLGATIDVQASYLVYGVWAMTHKCHWLIDHGFLAVIEEIDTLFSSVYYADGEVECRVRFAFLDTGYDTMNCYRYCLRHPRVLPIKGETGRMTRQTEPIRPAKIESFPGGKLFGQRKALRLLHIHPSHFKDAVAAALSESGDVNLGFHRDIDKDFISQMTGEVLREGPPDKYGNCELYWEKVHRNDFFDIAQYSFAMRHLCQNDLLRMAKSPPPEPATPDPAPEPAAPKPPAAPAKPANGGQPCPKCHGPMRKMGDTWLCNNQKCGMAVRERRLRAWGDYEDEEK